MAGISWIKVETTLPNKPVVQFVKRAVRRNKYEVVGLLISLLCWADGITENGVCEGYAPEDVDEHFGVQGLANGLIDAGWMMVNDDGWVCFCKWDHHNGESAKKRALNARKVAKCKAGKKVTENGYQSNQNELPQYSNAVTVSCDLDKNVLDKNKESNKERHVTHDFVTRGTVNVRGGYVVLNNPEQEAFLDVYGKQPRSMDAFSRAWHMAMDEVGDAAKLAECARMSIERLVQIDGGTEKQPTPERWLGDRKYRDFVKVAKVATKIVDKKFEFDLPEGL